MKKETWLGIGLAVFPAAFVAGFIYGAVQRTNRPYVDDLIIEHTLVDTNNQLNPRLIFACERRSPIFTYELATKTLTKDLTQTEAYRRDQVLWDSLSNSSVVTVFGITLSAAGGSTVWKEFKEGKAGVRATAGIIGGMVVGAPLGYWLANDIFDLNCRSKPVLERLEKESFWPTLQDWVFSNYYRKGEQKHCVPNYAEVEHRFQPVSSEKNDLFANLAPSAQYPSPGGQESEYSDELYELGKKVHFSRKSDSPHFSAGDYHNLFGALHDCARFIKELGDDWIMFKPIFRR